MTTDGWGPMDLTKLDTPMLRCDRCGCLWGQVFRLEGERCRDENWPDFVPCGGICKPVQHAAR